MGDGLRSYISTKLPGEACFTQGGNRAARNEGELRLQSAEGKRWLQVAGEGPRSFLPALGPASGPRSVTPDLHTCKFGFGVWPKFCKNLGDRALHIRRAQGLTQSPKYPGNSRASVLPEPLPV